MIAAEASTLDIERFRKVHALMTGGATAGERDAATARATQMAARAGLTLKQAMTKLDTQPKPKPVNIFEGFDDFMEQREPGYKAREAAKRAEREDRNETRRREILREHGSLKAFLDPTPLERILLAAGRPFAKRRRFRDVCGTMREFTFELGGSNSDIDVMRDISPEASAPRERGDRGGATADYHGADWRGRAPRHSLKSRPAARFPSATSSFSTRFTSRNRGKRLPTSRRAMTSSAA